MSRSDICEILGGQLWKHQSICNVNTELISAPTTTGVVKQTIGQASTPVARRDVDCSTRMTHIHEGIFIPNRVDAAADPRYLRMRPIRETVRGSALKFCQMLPRGFCKSDSHE